MSFQHRYWYLPELLRYILFIFLSILKICDSITLHFPTRPIVEKAYLGVNFAFIRQFLFTREILTDLRVLSDREFAMTLQNDDQRMYLFGIFKFCSSCNFKSKSTDNIWSHEICDRKDIYLIKSRCMYTGYESRN